MRIITETERLYLREFKLDDDVHFYKMNEDEDVIKFTGDSKFNSVKEARHFLENYKDYERNGMGRWAVCLKSNDEFLGWCGLKYHPNEDMVEVGYRYYKKHWGNGYATESCRASIKYGFNVLKLATIYAHTHIYNFNSIRVIEKCGLNFIEQHIYDSMPANLYKIEHSKFSK